MTPGRYLARAIVRRNGVHGQDTARPITIVRDPSVVVESANAAARCADDAAVAVPHRRPMSAGVVNGLANIVAQEEFTLSKPDRRVTSDLLLVRYPGTQRDLIPYRDVVAVERQAPIAGREQRLLDLFVKPTDRLREQARQIMLERRRLRAVDVQPDVRAWVPAVRFPVAIRSDRQRRRTRTGRAR